MTKSEKALFDKEVAEGFNAIRDVVSLIAQKMAKRYEMEIFSRLSEYCNRQIEIIDTIEDCNTDLAYREIRNAMKKGDK